MQPDEAAPKPILYAQCAGPKYPTLEPMLMIDTEQWLDCVCDRTDETAVALNQRIEAIYADYDADRGKYDYRLYGEDIAKILADERGWKVSSGDNTYNYDNDLDQDLNFYVIGPVVDEPYAKMRFLIASMHLGGDIRGNYGDYFAAKLYSPDDGYFGDRSIEVWCKEVLPEPVQEEALFTISGKTYPAEETFDNLYRWGEWLESEGIEDVWPKDLPEGIVDVNELSVRVTDKDGVTWECFFSNQAAMSC